MKKTICDICGAEIKDEHYIFPKHYWWVAPSIKFIDRYDVCRWCGKSLIESIRERRANNEHADKRD